jgi:4-hydroxybutyryl-CoA dehydratase/vinylacetyl-CoA-Delta-isomerase
MPMNAADYRESLRRYKPRVWVDGERIESVADAPQLAPGINAMGVTYDYALRDDLAPVMRAVQASSGKTVNRMLQTDSSSADLLNKLEAVRILCQETGCAQRYLAHDGFSALQQTTARVDAETGSRYGERFLAYLHDFQDKDLCLGIAMTDAKGDRSKRPHEQANPTATSTSSSAAQGHRHLGHQGDRHRRALHARVPGHAEPQHDEADADFAVCCAVPCDADGLTIVARPAGGPARRRRSFPNKYGQSTGVLVFDRVFVPWERVFLAGEWQHSAGLTYSYATHHRHTCIAARAGFGDLLIGAGALMCEANGFDPGKETHLREQMVQLISIVEGFYACGVAASVYATEDPLSKVVTPDAVFSNIGKLLLANQIYEMQRIAHYVSGGLIVTLPGPDEDHNPETRANLADVLRANPDVPYDKRIQTARFLEDLTASYQGGWYSVISLHGGGSPAAMKQEIWRNYPSATRSSWSSGC